jgi:hypothetical protein
MLKEEFSQAGHFYQGLHLWAVQYFFRHFANITVYHLDLQFYFQYVLNYVGVAQYDPTHILNLQTLL